MDIDILGTEQYMPQISEFTTVGTQKVLNIFFLVDISGSMHLEHRIEAVNEAFEKMIPTLKKVQQEVAQAFELRISIMTFDQCARWVATQVPIEEYVYEPIECSQWVTFYSSAFHELNDKLSGSKFMKSTGKISQPYIMFMTDGEPTEADDYIPELEQLLHNQWFVQSQRFAVLMGNDAINSPSARAAVSKFVVNTEEGIIEARDAAEIAAEVEAKTIIQIDNMTKHYVERDTDAQQNQQNDWFNMGGDGLNNGEPWYRDMDFDPDNDSQYI